MSSQTIFQKDNWHRIEYRKTPIYFCPDKPDWFIPNKNGDEMLQTSNQSILKSSDTNVVRFIKKLPNGQPFQHYTGRTNYLKLERLAEIWFHLTNRCNLLCTHCLFGSSSKAQDQLDPEQVLTTAADAHELGCRVFALTGGEPFVYPDIHRVIRGLLDFNDSHIVILTNGMNLPHKLDLQKIDADRLHLQISVDGIGDTHDHIRGKGTFRKLSQNLEWLREQSFPFTLSLCVTDRNVKEMPAVVEFAARKGAGNVHFMWYFIRGRGKKESFVPVDIIFRHLITAAERAEVLQIPIDNVESLKTQIFAPPGTIHDGSTAGWESVAVGPDGKLYPSAALVGIPELSTDLSDGLDVAWRQSTVLEKIRNCSSVTTSSPFRFLLGGGDIDHSYVHNKTFLGDDPYHALYEKIALWLLAKEAPQQPEGRSPQIRLRMGEILESCGAHGKVALVHSNCLLAIAHEDSLNVVKSFYADAVGDKKEDILNPVSYDAPLMNHIPEAFRFRGYGCGSPVLDADIQDGEDVADLGCGGGVECFVAARLTGKEGRVTGIDMLDPMLDLANRGLKGVIQNLGYANIEFKKGYLEALPLETASVDVVLSNCVMNLSVHKRKAYADIFRVLKPGGRLVISDVVCETEPDPVIQNDETLRGECIAGAMVQHQLMGLIEASGFQGIRLIKRFPYRVVHGHPFFSLTYSAEKPKNSEQVRVIYRGPLPHLVLHNGTVLIPGEAQNIGQDEAKWLDDQVFILDEDGAVTNVEAQNSCACYVPLDDQRGKKSIASPASISLFPRRPSGCMVCGAPITYFSSEQVCRCAYCQKEFFANSRCENGHYVCDACHVEDGMKVIQHVCATTKETDMIRLFVQIRQHPAIPVNGPEYHALVPGVILATYRNIGGNIDTATIETGIKRGTSVIGGHCAFMGVCGAAIGVGIAFSLILEANPLTPERRSIVQRATQTVLSKISRLKAARCCQRDSWLALKKAVELSNQFLPVSLKAEASLRCDQQHQNKECMGSGCPLFRSHMKRDQTGLMVSKI